MPPDRSSAFRRRWNRSRSSASTPAWRPAESGLGAGGNITVISKSGSNRFPGSVFEYKRDDALDAASKYDDKKQELTLDQFGGSIGGPLARDRTFFFGSFEGLRQKTGLTFTEAVPSDEARRRILAGEPIGSGAGTERGADEGGGAAARRFPAGRERRRPIRCSTLATNSTEAKQEENTLLVPARPAFQQQRTRCTCGISAATAISTRRIAPSPRAASARSSAHRIWWPIPERLRPSP